MSSEYLNDYLNKLYKEDNIVIVERNNQKFYVKFDKYHSFWQSFDDRKWELETFEVFDKLITENTIYLDIGAWIGPTILYASRLSSKVYGFEPSSAFDTLKKNVDLNPSPLLDSKVKLFNYAVGLENKTIQLGSSDSGNSTDSILDSSNNYDVKQIDLYQFLKSENVLQDHLFIKIDIEGAEYSLVGGLFKLLKNQVHFKAHVSTHPLILFRSLRIDRGFIISLIWVIFAQYKILKYSTKYVYKENFIKIKFPLYEIFRSIYKGNAYIFSNHKLT